MKNILGLDLGTNSIGWALIQQNFEEKYGKIVGLGSRIIPMSQDILGEFEKGNSISQTAERTRLRGTRRLRERHLLRRERLHRVLNVLDFLPQHYASKIDFTKRVGKFLPETETKFVYDDSGQFIFKESFNIGTIRLLHNKVTDEQWEHMKWYIKTHARDYQPLEAIGTGGNINKIFSMSKRKEGRPLTLDLLKDYYKELSYSSLDERKHLYQFREDRADVIVPALQVYISIMRWSLADEIYVPKIGLVDGLIKMLYNERK